MRKSFSCVFFLVFVVFFFACGDESYRNTSHADVPQESIDKGRLLAARYCGSCHMQPQPDLLDAKSWEQGVLPNMGPRLGIFAYGFERYPSLRHNPHLPPHFYPDTPVISFAEWQHIIDYYTATAPDSLVVPENKVAVGLSQFGVQQPAYKSANPLASFTAIDAANNKVLAFDMSSEQLLWFDAALRLQDSLKVVGAISDVVAAQDVLTWTNMGDINPGEAPLGSVQQWSTATNAGIQPLFDSLKRPVVIESADFNKDGRTDYVVGSFGYLTGNLSWYEALPNGRFSQHIIKDLPGAAQVYVTDENKDGLPDLWVLFAQGDESIRRYINNGAGGFKEEVVLRFPPVYGSTSFELVDMDGDGDQDIVYTCGDNADYSTILKHYHGVYVFLQEQNGQFRQRYFFHLNGAFKARTLDFDRDGDMDIAAISFFADYALQPEQGFVYLENKGNWNFSPTTFAEAAAGRWITLDAGDLDGDGWPDLILGNMAKPGSISKPQKAWNEGPLFLLLKNKGRP